MTDYTELRRLAEQATPHVRTSGMGWVRGSDRTTDPVRAFIAAANPAAILSLLDELDEAKWDLVRRGERVAALEELVEAGVKITPFFDAHFKWREKARQLLSSEAEPSQASAQDASEGSGK